ncbi:hypothetical protein B7P43_G10809 [Cryptotermes secundus]|uniref:Mos1 transposase HTH domain-containing protein n=1 Tax=Cryptotermes secundus TaxID=105785 RepID=A0A2J7RRK3_9NEOP|nr:hypothetical protein B7P43_G10809 [Cryptotermes secundus]
MVDFREQRAVVKFCFLLGKSRTETFEMLKTAYKDDATGKTQVFEWFSRFKNGEMSIDDKPRSGCPSTAQTHENVEKIREIIKEDQRRTVEEIVELSRPNPQAGGPPLVRCQRLLIQYIHGFPPYLEGVSSICNLRTRNVPWDPPNMAGIWKEIKLEEDKLTFFSNIQHRFMTAALFAILSLLDKLLSRHQNAGQNHDIKRDNRCFENVAQFRYLGTTITNQNLIQEEIEIEEEIELG